MVEYLAFWWAGISIITWFDGIHSLTPLSLKCRLQYGSSMMVRNASKIKCIACCVSIEASSNLLTTTMHGIDMSWCLCCVVSKVWGAWLEWLHWISITVAKDWWMLVSSEVGTWSSRIPKQMMSVVWRWTWSLARRSIVALLKQERLTEEKSILFHNFRLEHTGPGVQESFLNLACLPLSSGSGHSSLCKCAGITF